nr:hypothetical protein [Gammaproteobacteria bacterium]
IRLYGPQLLPGGDAVLFTVAQETQWDNAQIVVQSLETGERSVLVNGGSDARYLATGHIVYAFEDGLLAVAFDPDSLTLSGGPVSLVQGIARASSAQTGVAHYAVSDNGTLVAVRGLEQGRLVVWVDRQGVEEELGMAPQFYRQIALSPQGDRVAVTVRDGNEADLWVHDIRSGVPRRLTFNPEEEAHPTWTPDGTRIAYMTPGGIAWTAADGTGQPEILYAGSAGVDTSNLYPDSFTPDGGQLVFEGSGETGWDLNLLDLDGERGMRSLIAFEDSQEFAQVSPDGRWIAYQSNETGRSEIFVSPFPNVEGGKFQISTDGGVNVRWSPDSRTIYFRDQRSFYSVAVAETEPAFAWEPPTEFLLGNVYVQAAFSYDVHPDGERFLILTEGRNADGSGSPQLIVVQNWFEEIRRLAPTD